MKNRIGRYYKKNMLRPMLYRAFTLLVLGFTAALLWKRFFAPGRSIGVMYAALAVVFGALAWFTFLKLDGVKGFRHKSEGKKPPRRSFADMIDFVKDPVETGEELDADERSFCRMIAYAAGFLVFGILSFF